jgi:DNA invertase Pin-like site-specific DNA recombinase
MKDVMSRRTGKKLPPKQGWAVYLRTSSEEAQNPENSQRRQRHAIEQSLFSRWPLPKFDEYIDNLSGRYANNRPDYQRMLEDARAGCFSHVAVENAERFGRNDTEALVAIDELHELAS